MLSVLNYLKYRLRFRYITINYSKLVFLMLVNMGVLTVERYEKYISQGFFLDS